MATADALLRKRDYLGLLAVSNRHGEAVARVVQKMLDFMTKNPQADFAQAREIAETEGTRVATNLHNKVMYLADIGDDRAAGRISSAPCSESFILSARSAPISAPTRYAALERNQRGADQHLRRARPSASPR